MEENPTSEDRNHIRKCMAVFRDVSMERYSLSVLPAYANYRCSILFRGSLVSVLDGSFEIRRVFPSFVSNAIVSVSIAKFARKMSLWRTKKLA